MSKNGINKGNKNTLNINAKTEGPVKPKGTYNQDAIQKIKIQVKSHKIFLLQCDQSEIYCNFSHHDCKIITSSELKLFPPAKQTKTSKHKINPPKNAAIT